MRPTGHLEGIRFVFVMCILAFACSRPVVAQGLNSESKVSGLVAVGQTAIPGVLCDAGSTTGPAATSSCTANYSVNSGMTTGTGNAKSSAAYGVLRGFAFASSVSEPTSFAPNAGASATSDFTDSLTFSGLSGPATLMETISLNGNINGNNCFVLSPGNQLCGSASADFASFFSGQTGCDITSGSCTTSISVNDNSQIDLFGMLTVQASIGGNIAGG